MNEKEIAEIRRRFRPDKNNISVLRGCCVNEKREIVSEFEQPLISTPQEETENILQVLRRTLSGSLNKNLMDIEFETQQVVDSEEHRLLAALRDSALKDEEAVHAFYQKAVRSLDLEGNYLILLVHDVYDIPYRSRDGEHQEDVSSEVYSYILCSVCPIKMTKPALSYYMTDKEFRNCAIDWLVAAPELGFLFPAFDDRSTNIYNALYYSRDIAENHTGFVDEVFHCPLPMPAAEQKETFQAILEDTLAEDCSYDVVETVHEEFCNLIAEHKERKEPEPLAVSKQAVKGVLASCGVSENRLEAFTEKYDEAFGKDMQLSPKNIINDKKIEVQTPDVTIQVSAQRRDLVQTRVIDGTKYIVIRADEGVQVNGVHVHIE
ncbi:DUF4317 domain-containing protein [Massiliimalia massiliensis]|uniref:DUF4317 domain-containing protein n=1 Tax=Massiliimalia massiliensis TaxID=1852384 RepID=UPI0009868FEB|nr:DUF4317 domain-containing protein [Massiliimalia massiliensis]